MITLPPALVTVIKYSTYGNVTNMVTVTMLGKLFPYTLLISVPDCKTMYITVWRDTYLLVLTISVRNSGSNSGNLRKFQPLKPYQAKSEFFNNLNAKFSVVMNNSN